MERAYFLCCRLLGRLLRHATYSTVDISTRDGVQQVRKRRSIHAPVLVLLGEPLVRLLDAGVRILPRRTWIAREKLIYSRLYSTSIQVEDHGVLVLPHLSGRTLATLLEDASLPARDRTRAVALAVAALGRFHNAGLTHGDAMAENVMVDLATGTACWFDFETVHDPRRSIPWSRADDVRALIATCVLRAAADEITPLLRVIADVYADEEVIRLAAGAFARTFRRPLTFHLGQAGLSLRDYREIHRVLSAHCDAATRPHLA